MSAQFPFQSDGELADLLATQTLRCLGCGEAMSGTDWEPHGTCRSYYGAGQRVSYGAWSSILDRAIDEPLFDRWASAEPMLGVPSWVARQSV